MGGNGGETIRLGVGNNSRTFGYNIVEYNLFEGMTQAEMEIVSNKSSSWMIPAHGSNGILRGGFGVLLELDMFWL